MEWKFPVRNFWKVWYTPCPHFQKLWKMLFRLSLEISGNSNQNFSLNGVHSQFLCHIHVLQQHTLQKFQHPNCLRTHQLQW